MGKATNEVGSKLPLGREPMTSPAKYQARLHAGLCVVCGKNPALLGVRCMECCDRQEALRLCYATPKGTHHGGRKSLPRSRETVV